MLIVGLWVIPAPVQGENPIADALFPYLKEPLPYRLDGDSVIYEDKEVYLEASPSTLTSSGWVTLKYKTKTYSGDVDVVFGFNDNIQISQPQFLNPDAVRTKYNVVKSVKTTTFEPVSIIKNTVLTKADRTARKINIKQGEVVKEDKADIGDESINSKYAEVECDVIAPVALGGNNKSTVSRRTVNIAYDTFDGKKYTYKYNAEDRIPYTVLEEDWDKIDRTIYKNNWSNQGMNKWQSVYSGKMALPNKLNETKVWIEIPFAGTDRVDGKYLVGLKPSSLSVDQAKDSNQLWLIDPWYNSSWLYRKSLVINHTTDGAQTNYQMKLIVHYGGADVDDNAANGIIHTPSAVDADFTDLRFTTADGSTLLDYWIESYTASTNATVWVEVDSIAAHPNDTTIYMYYGNAGASAPDTKHNMGVATFIFYQDFDEQSDGNAPTGWVRHDYFGVPYGTMLVDNSQSQSPSNSMETINLASSYSFAERALTVTSSMAIDFAFRVSDTAKQSEFQLTNSANYFDYGITYIYVDGGNLKTSPSGATLQSVSANTWYTMTQRNINFADHTLDIDIDYVNRSAGLAFFKNDLAVSHFWSQAYTSGLSTWVDDIRTRKYTTNEPTWGSFGIQEINPTTAAVTTNPAISIEESTATLNATITAGSPTMRGFAYGTTSNATLPVDETPPVSYSANWTESGAFGVGNYSYNVGGLTSGDAYYYRAYIGNAYTWGSEESFLTKPYAPTSFLCSANSTAVSMSWTKATVGTGTNLYTTITYNTTGYPANPTDGTLSYNGTASSFSQGGLSVGTTYYFRAWSFAWDGTLSQLSDNYASCSSTPYAPYVITGECTGFGTSWAVLNGILTADAGSTTQIGFDYGLTSSYGSSYTETSTYTLGFPAGNFSGYISSLAKGTVYHYRAKALVLGIWNYGEDRLFSTKGSPVIYESWGTGGDSDSAYINSANITYQTFTPNTTAIPHSVTTMKLMLKRVGSPGTVTASIRATSNSTLVQSCWSYPTGADLASGTMDGSVLGTSYSWYIFTMTTETCLSANSTYAIVLQCQDADTSNYVLWQADAGGGYLDGNAGYSTDSGSTWVNSCPADMLFEIWGNPCIEVSDAKVFSSYIESGDWLITVLYKNLYPPYYSDRRDVSSLFVLQLYNATTSTVIAQTKCFEWGYKPGAIYLSATSVTPLQWGYAYRVRLYGLFAGNPYSEYVLQPTDWQGSDLTRLDNWVRSCASLMEQYYNTSLTTYLTDRGVVLNSSGGVIFATDIPQLSVVRPNLFSIVNQGNKYTQGTFSQTYQDTLVWQTMMGPQLTKVFISVGNTVGIGGATVGSWLGFMIYALVALFCFRPGHAIAAMVIPVPILIIAFGTGLAELALMGIMIAVATIIFVWQFWWKQG